MIVIWKIIRNFAVEKFNKMPMDYRHIKVLHHLTSSFNSLLPQTCGKQMKRSWKNFKLDKNKVYQFIGQAVVYSSLYIGSIAFFYWAFLQRINLLILKERR